MRWLAVLLLIQIGFGLPGGAPSRISRKLTQPELDSELIQAVENGNRDEIIGLIEQGANVNAPTSSKGSLLLKAISGKSNVAPILIKAGIDPNTVNQAGQTALMVAAAKNNIDLVKLLINAGADVNLKDHEGWTALMEAAAYGSPEAVKLLLEAGADANAKDDNEWTAFKHAFALGNVETLVLLVGNGEDANSNDSVQNLFKDDSRRVRSKRTLMPLVTQTTETI